MTHTQGSRRLRRSALVAAAAFAVVAGGVGAAPGAGAATPVTPKLKLVAASTSITADRYDGDTGVYLDLGAYLTVDKAPFELRVTRASYKDPVVVAQVTHSGSKTVTKKLPAGLVKDFAGLPGFLQVTITDSKGVKVASTSDSFCPNSASGRVRPDAPATSPYPDGCSDNPFTLGSVWGVQKGWAAAASQGIGPDGGVDLKAGTYTAKISVAKKYRDVFGIPNDQPTVKVTVRTVRDGSGAARSRMSAALPGGQPRTGSAPGTLRANAHRPTGAAGVPSDVPKPDLRALPAYGIAITDGSDGGEGDTPATGTDYLAFSATVWDAGPAPLVVDGFRTPGKETMDAYQYFYDAKGKQVGYTPTGTMEWDPRVGHQHWHFSDFASYRLLSSDKKLIVRSGKEAFCLANTDAIDYTVKNANWHPNNTDLATACGEHSALSVREVLDVGNGDTYSQYRPGQSFDISKLANGTYYIQVIANPDHRLKESSYGNNVALRKVILGGTPGHRTVKVPAYELVNAP
ncbi:lysyl oxidase family protein [Streptomyces sp. CBMA29]|uniref:lysyl oxidase family protein n=1 Tax=Streptomyces sp. CBMA29 TaxID=1896314 RepID=UPI001661B056|nr:lysyl oxidase family protein [Streptomyces sp. CBMA29]MBD0739942.1 protein-lysine 6-oxidase [Streptomyces sp. CBMA29]